MPPQASCTDTDRRGAARRRARRRRHDRAARRRVADGVVEQVAHHAGPSPGVDSSTTGDGSPTPGRAGRCPWPRRRRRHRPGRRRPARRGRPRSRSRRQRPGLDAGQLEQVVDQAGQPVGLLAHGAVVAGDGLGIVDDAVLERLDHGPDAGQRRAQVVGHPGHQLPPAALEGRGLVLGRRPAGPRSARSSAASAASSPGAAAPTAGRPGRSPGRSSPSRPGHVADRPAGVGHPPAEAGATASRPTAPAAHEHHPQDPQVVAHDEHARRRPRHADRRRRAPAPGRRRRSGRRCWTGAAAQEQQPRQQPGDGRAQRGVDQQPDEHRRPGCRRRPPRTAAADQAAARRLPTGQPAERSAASRLEPVADAPHRAHVAGRGRVGLDLLRGAGGCAR